MAGLMKHPTRKPLTLADFRTPKNFSPADKSQWTTIARWQREGMLTVKPLNAQSAMVELTAKGIEAVQERKA